MTQDASSSPAYDERFVLNNRREDIEAFQRTLLGEVERMDYDPTSTFAIRLALEEALSNAFKHGNKADPRKRVTVECRVDASVVQIAIEDEGSGFDPATIPDPTRDENIEIPSGRGIILMKSFMTEVQFEPPGNRVRMRFVRSG